MTAERIVLTARGQSLLVLPGIGGSLGWWRRERDGRAVDLLRPAPTEAIEAGSPGAMACFPLVPYSNRIRHGRFEFQGRAVGLPLNLGDHPHSIHGQGWQSAWSVVEEWPDRVVLDLIHDADAWPWAYAAREEIALDADGLIVDLTVTNLADAPMPAGLGLHPYFAGAASAHLAAGVTGVWQVDDEVMPTRHVPLTGAWNLSQGRPVSGLSCDNVFTGWDGTARIERPDASLAIVLRAESPLEFLVVYAPTARDFFCVEPVSHATDAFNRAAAGEPHTGMRVLGPGETLTARVAMTVEAL